MELMHGPLLMTWNMRSVNTIRSRSWSISHIRNSLPISKMVEISISSWLSSMCSKRNLRWRTLRCIICWKGGRLQNILLWVPSYKIFRLQQSPWELQMNWDVFWVHDHRAWNSGSPRSMSSSTALMYSSLLPSSLLSSSLFYFNRYPTQLRQVHENWGYSIVTRYQNLLWVWQA